MLEEVLEVSVSVDGSYSSWEFFVAPRVSRHLFRNWKSNWNYIKTCNNIKAQKDAGSINLLEYLEKSAKHEAEYILNHDGSSTVSLPTYILLVILEAIDFILLEL